METLESHHRVLDSLEPVGVTGRVCAVRGLTVSVADFPAPVGGSCRIVQGRRAIEARVIGFAGQETLVMPLGGTSGIRRRDPVEFTGAEQTVGVGPDMLGRVLDGFGRPIDGKEIPRTASRVPIWPEPISALRRGAITAPLSTGVRAIDAMLTVGRGQRMSVLSGSGVGKSVLLGMIARNADADVIVIGLIGERGREVRDFIDRELGPEGLQRSIVVVSTSDEPPLVRVQAGAVATAIAEHFRDRGADVLLVVDSLTRLATAQRQVGLAAGEPPTTRGFTPSVFSLLPQLLERCGRMGEGSITGFYSVLVESEDLGDPVADAVQSVTDGHIRLSRKLANRGRYPAIDLLQSVSRVMGQVADSPHVEAARELQRLLAVYEDIEELVHVGAYRRGTSAEYDLAIESVPQIRKFVEQLASESTPLAEAREALLALAAGTAQAPLTRTIGRTRR
jgi:flagellum-specific ATP synthase